MNTPARRESNRSDLPTTPADEAALTGAAPGSAVFISHTSELATWPAASRSYVQAALDAVAAAGMVSADMRYFPPADLSPVELCRRRVRQAQVYVGVIGFRYGSMVPGLDVSYTEFEFDAATNAGLPRLVILMRHEPVEGFLLDKDRQRIDNFRSRLIEEVDLVVAWFDTPDNLEFLIYQGLMELRHGAASRHSTADVAEVHRTVADVISSAYKEQVRDNAPLAGLLDREEELQDLTRFCASDDTYLYLQADPWAGKTALMATLALAPPAGVRVISFFVTARLTGQSDSSAFTDALLEQCAALAGEPLPVAISPSAKDAHRRRLLQAAVAKVRAAGERLLLIVDGLDEDQSQWSRSGFPSIASLLPKICPEGLQVLVAGRPHPDIPVDVPVDHPLRTCMVRLLTPSPHARALEKSAQQELDRVLATQEAPRDVLGLVAASSGGLTLADLEELADQPQDIIARLFASWFGRTIRSRVDPTSGAAPKIYLFAHDTLQVQAVEILGPVQLAKFHRRIDVWAAAYRDRGWPAGMPRYLLRSYPQVLAGRQAEDRLAQLFLDPRYLVAKISLLGTASAEAQLALVRDPQVIALVGLVRRKAHLIRNGDVPGTVENILFGDVHLADPALAAALSEEYRMTPVLWKRWQGAERSEAMLRRTLIAHTDCIETCVFDGANKLLVSAGGDGLVRLWDIRTGTVAQTIDIGRCVRSCSFSPDGKQIAIAVDDGTVRVHAVTNGQQVVRLVGHNGWVEACAFSPDGSLLASSSSDGTARLWDCATWRLVRSLRADGVAAACGFSSDGAWIATTGNDGMVRVWEVRTGRLRTELRGHVGPAMCCAVTADDVWLASGGADGTLRIWDAVTGRQVRTLDAHDGTVLSCAISRDGKWLASTGNDGKARVWDAATGAEWAVLDGHAGAVTCCAASVDGALLVTGGEDATLRVWTVHGVDDRRVRTTIGRVDRVTSARVSTGGELLAEGHSNGTVGLRETATGAVVGTVPVHQGAILACVVDPSCERLITSATDGRAYLHFGTGKGVDFDHRQRVELGTGHSMTLSCTFGPEHGWFVTVDESGATHFWDCGTGAWIRTIRAHDGPVLACVTSSDGSMLATAGSDSMARIWDVPSGTSRRTLRGHEGPVLACDFSPDGSVLSTAGNDGTVRIWNSLIERPKHTLLGHQGPVLACAISPDAKSLISAGSDATARIWDVSSGELVTTTRLDAAIISCAWVDAGNVVVLTTGTSTGAYNMNVGQRPRTD